MTAVQFNSPGTNLNRMMDRMGLPDAYGDRMGAMLDAKMGNQMGVARNLFDMYSGVPTAQLDRLMGQQMPHHGHCHRPQHRWQQGMQRVTHRQTFRTNVDHKVTVRDLPLNRRERGRLKGKMRMKMFFNKKFRGYVKKRYGGDINKCTVRDLKRFGFIKKGRLQLFKGPFGLGRRFNPKIGQRVANKINSNPRFRAHLSRKLGAQIHGATADGRVTASRTHTHFRPTWRPQAQVQNCMHRCHGGFQNVANQLQGMMGSMGSQPPSFGMGGMMGGPFAAGFGAGYGAGFGAGFSAGMGAGLGMANNMFSTLGNVQQMAFAAVAARTEFLR